MGYGEILMRVRTESFVSAHWPGRAFAVSKPDALPVPAPSSAHVCWAIFADESEPQSVGLLLHDIADADPVFVVMLRYADGAIRQSLWRYTSKLVWRRLGSDGSNAS
jgi:hypothetical protein